MKKVIGLMVLLALLLGTRGWAAQETAKGAAGRTVPGAEWAQTLSTITGVAISPLLGVGAVGAWKYFQSPQEQRVRLPWFAQPYFWAPALLLVALVFAKDTMGPLIPTVLKKPLDVAEVVENKVSALVATGAFVPFVISVFPSSGLGDGSGLGWSSFAAIDWASAGNAVLTPFAMAVFVVVWLAAHAINVLILVSPFATVDLGLKSLRLALLSSVALTSFANPYWGAAWSAVLVVVCYFLAGWSFRLTVFGTVFAWDLVTLRRTRFKPDPATNWAFTTGALESVPARTYGTVRRQDDGQFVLRYRRWLVLAPQTVTLPAGSYAIGKGVFHPELLRLEGERSVSLLKFPPRFRTHDEELDRIYRLGGVRPIGMVAVWRWLLDLFGFKPRPLPAAA